MTKDSEPNGSKHSLNLWYLLKQNIVPNLLNDIDSNDTLIMGSFHELRAKNALNGKINVMYCAFKLPASPY
jgi:hypothetical protein